AEYSDAAVHFSHVTTKGGVELIRQAKKKKLKITASVPAHHLLIPDDSVESFDANFKVRPPFRNKTHIDALIKGLKDGTIDAIISDHEPQEIESKFSEFSEAEFGISALETTFSAAFEALRNKMDITEIISKLTTNPRAILGIEQAVIEEGNKAELTIFSPSINWELTKEGLKSQSKNSPLLGATVQGLPIAIINNNQLVISN
ncbi:dihydroorotase family protein, partial [Bacteroidota bacterium]